MGGIFSSPSLPPASPPPTMEDPAIAAARKPEQASAQKAKGRAASVLTGGLGDTGEAPTNLNRLLGE